MSERTDGTDAPDETVRVLVTDDDPFVRRALAGILDDAGLDVVGLADDGEAAVQLVAAADEHLVGPLADLEVDVTRWAPGGAGLALPGELDAGPRLDPGGHVDIAQLDLDELTPGGPDRGPRCGAVERVRRQGPAVR